MTTDEKIENISSLVKKYNIPLSFEIWHCEKDRDDGYGFILAADKNDKYNFKNMIKKSWKHYKTCACVEIVFGKNNRTLWHISPETPNGIIDDFDYNEFIQFIKSFAKTK